MDKQPKKRMATGATQQSPTTLPSTQDDLPPLPDDSLTEEEVDRYLVESGILHALLAQTEVTPASSDWETELNEL